MTDPPDKHTVAHALAVPTRQVGERCELFLPFARGGMATVFLGRWKDGDRWRVVAVKTMLPQLATNPRLATMFEDEVKLVARIHHPNVLPTVGIVREDAELFMAMDYVHGSTLSQLVRAADRHEHFMPLSTALAVMRDVLRGLHAAHAATDEHGASLGLIHRDVSPQNVMVGVDGRARLIDFGVAKALNRSSTTQTGEIKGKLSYLAPEQLLGEALSCRTDVYGASVVMWQLLTGRKLFDGDNLAEITHGILRTKVVPPSEHRYGVTRALDELVMRGLARDPAQRWSSAAAMADAIDELGRASSHRDVGAWVERVDRGRLDELAQLVRAIESAPQDAPRPAGPLRLERPASPPLPPRSAPRRTPPAPLALRRTSAAPIHDDLLQGTRTQLTSQADLTPTSPAPSRWGVWLSAAAALAFLVSVSAWPSTGHFVVSPAARPFPVEVRVAPPLPAHPPAIPRPTAPPLEAPPTASSSASAAPAKPPGYTFPPRRFPRPAAAPKSPGF